MQHLEERKVSQYILFKHHLLENSQAENILQAVNDIIALHATSAGTPHLSLFARIKNFRRENFDAEFYTKRSLVRLRAMRNTLFITSIELAPLLYQAVKPQLLSGVKQVLTSEWGMKPSEFDKLKEKLLTILSNGGKTIPEIKQALPKNMIRTIEHREGKSVYRMSNLSIALNLLIRMGIVASEKDSGVLRITEANRYMLFREIYPKLNLESVDADKALITLIRRYIKVFGPVTEEDITWWTGLSRADVKNVLKAIDSELLQVTIEGFERKYLMLKTDYQQFNKFKPLNICSVLLLPYEDPYIKGYKVRDRLITAEHEKEAYAGGGVQPTILLDGKIIGTWNRSMEEGKGPMVLRLFKHPDKEIEKKVLLKAETLGKMMAKQKINIEIKTH